MNERGRGDLGTQSAIRIVAGTRLRQIAPINFGFRVKRWLGACAGRGRLPLR
jgi:hypothetical protein